MIHLIRSVTRVPIYVFGPKMTFTDNVLTISKEAQQQRYITVVGINTFAAGKFDPQRMAQDRQLKSFFASQNFTDPHYVSVLDVQCGVRLKCDILSPEGKYLYFDAGHFTLEGARRFGYELKQLHPELF